MGFAVVHMMKIKSGGVGGIQSHNERLKESRNNPDIDYQKSCNNINLDQQPADKTYYNRVKDRIKELKLPKAVRKDAVVMCNFVVTSDEKTMKAMSPEKQKEFFKDSVKWFGNRYGAENIVNATVHMDETTPHLHVGLVPIKDGRLSAKALFDKKEMIAIQTDFAKEVGQKYGLERGKEGSERTHLSEQRFKLETAKQQEQQAVKFARKTLSDVEEGEKCIETLENKKNALEGQINELKGRVLSVEELANIKPQKTLTGAIKGVKLEDVENLKKTAINANADINKLKMKVAWLKEDNEAYKQVTDKNADTMSELRQENRKLKKVLTDFKDQGKAMHETLKNHDLIPEALNVLKTIKAAKVVAKKVLSHNNDCDMER